MAVAARSSWRGDVEFGPREVDVGDVVEWDEVHSGKQPTELISLLLDDCLTRSA